MGLPGSGKTTFAKTLAPMLHTVHFNADDIRKEISPHLGFSLQDRIEQARRIGWLCYQVTLLGNFVVADLICPTNDTRVAFGTENAFVVWVDRISHCCFEDTNELFVPPDTYDIRVCGGKKVAYWAKQIADTVTGGELLEPLETDCAGENF